MTNRNIIVIGASAGGFQTLIRLVAGLPADLNAAIFIVWHMAPNIKGMLPLNLNKLEKLPAANAVDMEPIETRRIYVAPPDFHLMLEKGFVRVTRGPKENRFRPAVDPLFRSAAFAYGERVIGIVLTGALDDGAAGLWTIKQYGGLAIVQDPSDAEVSSMPENALRAVKADHVVPVKDMGKLLTKLVKESVTVNGKRAMQDETTELEVNIALEQESLNHNIMEYGSLTPYTCPECHGVLTALKEGGRIRFRCHTGHAFSADSLLAAISESIEESLWSAVRNVQESVMLLNHMGDHFAELNQPRLAATYFQKAKDAERRAEIVRRTVEDHEQLSLDSIEEQAGNDNPS